MEKWREAYQNDDEVESSDQAENVMQYKLNEEWRPKSQKENERFLLGYVQRKAERKQECQKRKKVIATIGCKSKRNLREETR